MHNAGPLPSSTERPSVVPRAEFEREHLSRRRAEQAVHLLRVLAEITSDLGGAHAEGDVLDVVRRRIAAYLETSRLALWALVNGSLQQLTATSGRLPAAGDPGAP